MSKPIRNPKSPRRTGQFRPVSTYLNTGTTRLRKSRGFADHSLLARWESIVGVELGAICQPREIRTRRGQGATLVIACLSAYASELQMRSEEIIARINSTMGANTIAKILLAQQHIGFERENLSRATKKTAPRPQNLRPVPASLLQVLANADDDGLRKALQSISDSFYEKGN